MESHPEHIPFRIIIFIILNNSKLISDDNNNLLYEKLNDIDLNDLIISNDYNEKDIIFCSYKN